MNNENFFKNFILGVTSEYVQVDTKELNRHASVKLTEAAKDTVNIVSRHLDPAVYSHSDFTQAVTKFVTKSNKTTMKILLHDGDSIIKHRHMMLELIQKLTSKFSSDPFIRILPCLIKAFLLQIVKGISITQSQTVMTRK